jgi:hypothetical protein
MAHVQVKNIDDDLYAAFQQVCKSQKRSVSQQLTLIMEQFLISPHIFEKPKHAEVLDLAGSWEGNESAEDIINDIQASRTPSTRFDTMNDVFN